MSECVGVVLKTVVPWGAILEAYSQAWVTDAILLIFSIYVSWREFPVKKKKILESSSRNKWYPDNASSLSFVVLFVWWWINGQLTECSKKQEIDGKQPVEKQKVLLVPNKNTEWFCNLSN